MSADVQQQLDKTCKDAEAKAAAAALLEDSLQGLSAKHSNLQHQVHEVKQELQLTKAALNAAQESGKQLQASLDEKAIAHQAQISSRTLAQHQLQDGLDAATEQITGENIVACTDVLTC